MTIALARPAARLEAAGLSLLLLATALAWDATHLDLAVARLAGSAAGFPWREHWLLAGLLHEGGRRLSWLLAAGLLAAIWWPVGPLRRLARPARIRLALSTVLAALAVSTLKAGSATSCPWDLAQFGGAARYTSHWSLLADGGPGRCFPAGHASAGFAFVGGYFAFRPVDEQLARRWLAIALAAGLLLGLGQQWRGAHFMSHTLWTAVVCWFAAWAVHAPWRQER